MSSNANDQQQRILTALKRRAAAGQINRRGFLDLAAAIGIQSAFAVAFADQVMAAPAVRGHGGRSIAASYDYIVIGAGSAGCTLAARLSEDVACRVLLIEAGGSDINRPALQSPVLWPTNSGLMSIGPIARRRRQEPRDASSTGREAKSSADRAASMR